MAGVSLLALLDDIAALMDDVSLMTKVAAKKTAGVLGDDLAVNAEKVTGVAAERELPVVYAVFKGSLLNKLILVPAALVLAAVAPWLIGPLLICGGLFLCFEGFEKVWHYFSHSSNELEADTEELRDKLEDPDINPLELEKKRISGAVRTDLILSAEIIVITLGIVAESSLLVRAGVLTTIALAMTFGVYGLVAAIVKIDDLGLRMAQVEDGRPFSNLRQFIGRSLFAFAPRLMQGLTIFGTFAMFLVGGGILVHGVSFLHHASEIAVSWASTLDAASAFLAALAPHLVAAGVGIIAGAMVLMIVSLFKKSTSTAKH